MQTATGLVVAPAPLPPGLSPARYAAGAVGSPVCLSLAVFAGCVGLGCAGVIGAVLAVAVFCGLGLHAGRYRRGKAYLDDHARAKAQARREQLRLKQLRPLGAGRL